MIIGIIAFIIFAISLTLIFTEKINRTIAALGGAAAMVIVGTILGFYNEEQAIEAIDIETIGLLLGMMLLVAMLEPTGFFEYMAIMAARSSKGSTMRLLIMLGAVTTVLSMFLDNVTTVVLIAPVTILISEILGVNPAPLLISEALLSNTGGIATLVGDPPNVLIASAAGFVFNDFLVNSLPIIVIVWMVALILLRFLFRNDFKKKSVSLETVYALDTNAAINDRSAMIKVLIVLGGAIVLFFFEKPLHISPAFIALSASAVALVWVQPDVHKTFERIEWGVLAFFIGLFVMVGGLESAGLLEELAHLIGGIGQGQTLILGVAILWLVALLSAVVDNIPITIALIPVIIGLEAEGINVEPLWWALAFGAGLGGNGTIIGSTANVVVASVSERTRNPITSVLWIKRGLPVMIVTLLVTTVLYIIAYPFYVK